MTIQTAEYYRAEEGGGGADYSASDDDRIVGTAGEVYIAASGGDDVVDGAS